MADHWASPGRLPNYGSMVEFSGEPGYLQPSCDGIPGFVAFSRPERFRLLRAEEYASVRLLCGVVQSTDPEVRDLGVFTPITSDPRARHASYVETAMLSNLAPNGITPDFTQKWAGRAPDESMPQPGRWLLSNNGFLYLAWDFGEGAAWTAVQGSRGYTTAPLSSNRVTRINVDPRSIVYLP